MKEVNHQFSSVAQSCLTLWEPMNCSTPGLPVHHQLPEFTQTHVHPPLLLASLLFTAICKASSDSYFAFLHFFFLGMVLITVSCTLS